VQRFAVKAGDYEIEIERGPMGQVVPTEAAAQAPAVGASGAFSLSLDQADLRVPVLAPLVGTFYEAAQPGAKPFVQVGDVVDVGQTVCIVEAMKLMNEVAAGEAGRVAEIVVGNGEPVEFEQVLMYLEPAGG
jgi:acetyl-CoA carboxylase biotin carboxyl carrier protein